MAVYFDHRLDSAGPSDINRDFAWSQGTTALLAVASESNGGGGTVNIFNEEGEKIQHRPIINQAQVCNLAWHLTRKILAVGWQTGEIMIWNEGEQELFEAPHLHKSEIAVLHWNASGTHLVSGDKSGLLLVWRTNIRGNLGPEPAQHHLQEPLAVLVFRPSPPQDPALDIASLARAAVSGDESALDMFNWKRSSKGTKVSASFANQESLSFFVGGSTGGVYYVNESAHCTQCFGLDYSIIKLLYYEEKNILVTVTENLLLTQHTVLPEGETKEILKVKMSGRTEEPSIGWAGKGILATATGEQLIRMWDFEQNDNYVLNLDGHSSYDTSETLLCVSYNPEKGILASGTNMGNIALWKFMSPARGHKAEGAEQWILMAPATVEGPVRQIEWCTHKGLMAVNTIANVFILSEHVMSASFHSQTAVVQYAPSSLSIELFQSGSYHDLKTDVQVKGVYTTKDALAVWNGRRVIVYEYTALKIMGSFLTEATVIAIYEQNIYTIEQNKVQVRTFQGTVKQLLTFAETEGHPVSLDICGQYMVVATNVGIIRIYDLSRREAKAHATPKNMADVIPAFGTVISAKVNCNGSRISMLVKCGDGTDSAKLWIWDIELDTVQYFNFLSGRGEQDDFPSQSTAEGEEDKDTNDAERGKNQAARDIAGRFPISHHWDPEEPKLLVCEAKCLPHQSCQDDKDLKKKPSLTKTMDEGPVETMVVSLFCTSENGVLIQDSFPMSPQYNTLLGIEVPYLYFVKKTENKSSDDDGGDTSNNQFVNPETGAVTYHKLVARKIMRDFVGLESSDRVTRDAMMNFSFHLTTGNMDEAFKSIKLIKSESVWENMAKMCVKSRRLDVASVCLGNMGHARGAKALREAMKEPELDARVAVLAIQLGLYEDAERLLKNCKRYDLLNEFYQDQGQWGKALETAEMYDRIHLRTTYYNYARHLEDHGNTIGAIPNYEKSETHRFEVPRMLVDDSDQLEQYISKSKDKKLRQWWAQFMESTGDMDTAIQYYETAQDYFSLVRVYCYCGNMEKASKVCNDTGDKAACYYLARQYENQDQIKEAIHFFTRAQAYGSAIRLCKENNFEDQLINLALMGRPEDMMEAARYFEQRPNTVDKAVMLYHKAGNFSKALDLAFTAKQFGALQMISSDLDERADPELLQRCANFFLDNGQYDKAVDLLAMGKKYWEAVKICMDQHVEITEDLAEKLTPGRQDGAGEGDDMERLKLLEAVAEVCMLQGQYHLATKKFTQAGNKVKAMKALLKSGDTEKIVFFAGVSRQKEIYVMAANYLQSVDWRKDPEIMKNIIAFYTKGRALDSLASFYEACAQVEIDEYQNYDKALGALGEAYKCLSKAQGEEGVKEDQLGQLKHKMTLIKRFVSARRLYDENAEEAAKQCQVLLEEADVDTAVRIGDVYGFLIEHYARKERWKAAYASLEEMCGKMPSSQLAYYVNMKTIKAIHQALNIPMKNYGSSNRINGFSREGEDEEEGGFVEEEVIDDVYSAGDNV